MRPIHPADCAAVAALIRHAFAGLGVAPPPSALCVTAADVAAHLAAGGGGVLAEPDRGCLLWAEAAGTLQVSRVAVSFRSRRQGVAREMLAQADREADRRGLASLTLSTRLALPGNRRLFEACGFREVSRMAHPGFSEPTFVTLVKTLVADRRAGPFDAGRGNPQASQV